MHKNIDVNIEMDFTKIVKYAFVACIIILAAVFMKKACKKFVKPLCCAGKCGN